MPESTFVMSNAAIERHLVAHQGQSSNEARGEAASSDADPRLVLARADVIRLESELAAEKRRMNGNH